MIAVIIFFLILFSYLIAENIGSKRHIGSNWSFVLSFFLTPIIGLIIAFSSPPSRKEHSENIFISALTAFLMIGIAIFLIWTGINAWKTMEENEGFLNRLPFLKRQNAFNVITSLYFGLGCFVAGIYCGKDVVKKWD